MALFRCASGSSGGGATITVTYSSDFYGETVTCSHGTKTYSKVATSSGTLEFSVDEEGTWTISCMGFSDTADVVLSYEAELVSIPDGETVLPTDDIPTWLACAQIDNSKNLLPNIVTNQTLYGVTFTKNADGTITANGTSELEFGVGVNMGDAPSTYIDFPYYRGNTLSGCTGGSSSTYYMYLNYSNDGTTWGGTIFCYDGDVTIPADKAGYKNVVINIKSGVTLNNVVFKPMIRLATDANPAYEPYRHYTTLSQVLADSFTYNALLGDSNACAYMKRSTTWASRVKVPTMTSNTTPEGECFTQMDGTTYNSAYQCFDGNTSIGTYNNGTYNATGYKFTEPIIIKAYSLSRGSNANTWFGAYKVQASNNGSTWVDLTDTITVTSSAQPFTINGVLPDNETSYQYYRFYLTDKGGKSYLSGVGYQFYSADADITTSQYAMSTLGRYDVACDALLSDSTWASAILSSSYADYVLNTKVPTMTSNTTPSGVVSASSVLQTGYEAYKAFDGDVNTRWCSSATTGVGQYVSYDFGEQVVLKAFHLVPFLNTSTLTLKSYKIQGSNDNFVNDVNDLFEETLPNEAVDKIVYLNNDDGYRYLRLYSTSDSYMPSKAVSVSTLQFYGRKSSGEKIHGATGDTYYYISGGQHVPVTDPALLDTGTYTIYSNGIAKNPEDLSADYGKQIRITPNTKEIVVMPDGALYWYGYKNVSYTIINTITITDNTNNETLSGGTTVDIAYVQRDLTGISSVVMILNSSTGGTEDSLWCNATAPTSPYGQWTPSIKTKYNTTTGNKKSINVSSMTGNNYVGITLWYAKAVTYDALFME